MLQFIARLALAAPKVIIAGATLLVLGAGYYGIHVTKSLSAAGFRAPDAESSQVANLMSRQFGQGDLQLVFTVTDPAGGARSVAARAVGTQLVEGLETLPYVAHTSSAWTVPPPLAAGLLSRDGKTGLVVVGINGDGSEAQRHAKDLADRFAGPHGDVSVLAGGPAAAYVQLNAQSEHDLLVMEALAIPFSFLVLVGVFGGLLAAAVPLAVGIWAIVGSMAMLRVLTSFTEVSTFALNLTIAMGLALAVDYTLLILSRYREERAAGVDSDAALLVTMATAGRTVVFSATTVGLSMVALALFPMYFLRSFAFAGITVVALTALGALVLAPAAIVLLGARLDALDLRPLARRLIRRAPLVPSEHGFWYRTARFAIRRAVVVAIAGTVLLLTLGAPFTHVRWGFPDERMLPASASARQVGDRMRTDFGYDPGTAMTIVVPDASGIGEPELARFARDLSLTEYVDTVSAPTGTYVGGLRTGPPSAPTEVRNGSAYLTVRSSAPPEAADRHPNQLDWIHTITGPDGRAFLVGGSQQITADNAAAITGRLPLVLTVMAAISFVLLFLLTGSVVLPIKAVLLNVLSLTATFGALVWIFQDGALGALGTTATGTLVAQVPVLLFCVAFGLSMDYEVFLIARIREYWLASGQLDQADNDEAIAMGLARTGRIVTAAALLMGISFSALMASQVSLMVMFGLGLTLAVLMDATLVRMLMVPAFMHLLGRRNWWAPARMARLHERFGIHEVAPARRVARTGRHRARRVPATR